MANNPAERRERALLVPVGKRDSEMQTVGAVAPDITTQALSRDVVVPMVRISLVTSLQVPSYQSVLAEVRTDLPYVDTDPLLLQYRQDAKESLGVQAEDVLIHLSQDQPGKVLLSNATGFTQHLEAGEFLGEAAPVVIVSPPDPEIVRAFTVTTSQDDATDFREKRRRQTLKKSLEEPDLPPQEKQALLEFLTKYHHAFSLEDGERGEIDLIYMEINTGEARPKKQRVRRVRRVPFALRQVVAGHLAKMQRDGVIQPSRSPWSSPVVLVKKRDGTHRFCIDYRALNSVTKPDSFPLPRIEDLLDQLGGSTYFSTIDLASGFWQIRMHPDSQQKTAFSTQQGLFEFRVMPFGLTNAPAVFQRLMQQVVAPLNPSSGPDFVSVYLDDILVFSRNLGEHMVHLTTVIEKLAEVGLKLKPSKCHFAKRELEYLGHVVSRDGLKTSPRLVEAVQHFPAPESCSVYMVTRLSDRV